MHIFRYPEEWADIVTAQLAASHRSRSVELWGYACLVLNSDIEKVIRDNYEMIDAVTGKHLHVFAMIPPPRQFIDDRFRELEKLNASVDKENALEIYDRLRRRYPPPDTSTQMREKAELLQDLRPHGVKVSLETDFLFFDFENYEDEVNINVIAAKTAPIHDYKNSNEVKKLFQNMSNLAENHYSQHHSAEQFVSSLNVRWAAKIGLKKTLDLASYISMLRK